MKREGIDILVVTYNRPEYTKLSLSHLLDSCDETTRVWIWQNGNHEDTVETVRGFLDHPNVFRFHHSPTNEKLRKPTNWLWEGADGEFLSKVDDDCLVPKEWLDSLRRAHRDCPEFGVVGCWSFAEEDYVPSLALKKVQAFPGGHHLLLNLWIGGTGFLMKRECVQALGPLKEKQSFQSYCIELSKLGWINGWYHPFLLQDHMDDPRSPNTLLKTDADLLRYRPLSSRMGGVQTLSQWQAQLMESALLAQRASIDIKQYVGWRMKLKNFRTRLRRVMGRPGWF